MNKRMALDIGNAWTGIALTDATGMFARPETTIKTTGLIDYLTTFLKTQPLKTIVVGNPITMKGTKSIQTELVHEKKRELEEALPDTAFVLWDERLSSKRAQAVAKKRLSQQEKLMEHARAAAFILDSYITFLQFHGQ